MLTPDEKDYLEKISAYKKVVIKPFNPLALNVAQQIINQVHQVVKNIYDSIAWKFRKQGYDIEFYLTDPSSVPMKRQIAVFYALKRNKNLLKEYEVLKEKFNGKSFKDYQKKKYEFYHKILDKKP